jgi:hypothetical protein
LTEDQCLGYLSDIGLLTERSDARKIRPLAAILLAPDRGIECIARNAWHLEAHGFSRFSDRVFAPNKARRAKLSLSAELGPRAIMIPSSRRRSILSGHGFLCKSGLRTAKNVGIVRKDVVAHD